MRGDSDRKGSTVGLPDVLYHYTTQEGLLGILEKQEIWATDVRFLNDVEEFEAGLEVAHQMATESASEAGADGEKTVRWFVDTLRHSFSEAPIFSISLTGALKSVERAFSDVDDPGDRLNMWRGYASRGICYSVGLTPGEMAVDLDGVDLQECSYLPGTKREYLRPAMNDFGDLLNACNARRLAKVGSGVDVQRAMDEMRDDLDAQLPSVLPDLKAQIAACKHEGFWEEREWRLTVAPPVNDERVFHTSGRFGVTPRIAVRLHGSDGLLPIRRIVVGPSPHKADALESLRGLLLKRGYRNVEISASRIPYRNW